MDHPPSLEENAHVKACMEVLYEHRRSSAAATRRRTETATPAKAHTFIAALEATRSPSAAAAAATKSTNSAPRAAEDFAVGAARKPIAADAVVGESADQISTRPLCYGDIGINRSTELETGRDSGAWTHMFRGTYTDLRQASSVLPIRASRMHLSEKGDLDPHVKAKLTKRTVMMLLFAMPYAIHHSDLREAVLLEPPFKKLEFKIILKAAAKCMRTCLGMLLRKLEGLPGAAHTERAYYVSQGVMHSGHLATLITEREHSLRGFLLFLAPCFITCRGVLHTPELIAYLTACGRDDFIQGFTSSDLAKLTLPRNHKVNGRPLSHPPVILDSLWNVLLECRLLKYLSFTPITNSEENAPQVTAMQPTERFMDEFSLRNFRKEVREFWDVDLPKGDLRGQLEFTSEESEMSSNT